ncbi:AUGMIN FAMILY MEMBER [Salix purpurea]|uniref:AUGMIN FAMILY MEMBER n=1 Tax=Salix purpurea TaxID=77065 RepID=A0A9Q0PQ46_SALPP|nr:AUGMIN FAMILY MEMBER [Salix purpurea]
MFHELVKHLEIAHLEEWSHLDRGHSSSLEGATEALKASTLRLPVGGKAVADVQNLKDAVGSAVDVMQAMASSICSLSSKVEDMNSLVADLVNVTAKERHMLEQCKDFLSTLATVQVKDCSVRTHILQLNRLPTTSSLTTLPELSETSRSDSSLPNLRRLAVPSMDMSDVPGFKNQ